MKWNCLRYEEERDMRLKGNICSGIYKGRTNSNSPGRRMGWMERRKRGTTEFKVIGVNRIERAMEQTE